MTRIPCHGPRIATCESGQWRADQSKQGHGLWIGRSRFKKATTRNSKASSPLEVVFHGQQAGPMEVEQEGVDGGARRLRDRNVCEKAPTPTGLSRMTLSQLVEEAKKGGAMIPEKPTRDAEGRQGLDGRLRRHSLPFRRYRGWAFDHIGVPGLGGGRGRSEPESQRRPGQARQLEEGQDGSQGGGSTRGLAGKRPQVEGRDYPSEPSVDECVKPGVDQGDTEIFSGPGDTVEAFHAGDQRGDPKQAKRAAEEDDGAPDRGIRIGGGGAPETQANSSTHGIEGGIHPL